ncbi:MAG: DEAD/DEAH box helicase [Phycisphaerales bacterium]|nr:DEAD/DEAH box helicase [Planctomycetota bacterium]
MNTHEGMESPSGQSPEQTMDDANHVSHAEQAEPAPHGIVSHHEFKPVQQDSVFDEAADFAALGLRSSVLKGLTEMGFSKPTMIQAKLIPVAITGRDVLGQAKTGTGKTAAFGLPLIHMCGKDTQFQALILAPTRELAIQITDEINDLAKFTPIRAVTLYGGQSIQAQTKQLQSGSHIVVGTPGRVLDMLQRGYFHLKNIRFAVLDEVDRMFDIGFRDDIKRILGMCPRPGTPPEGRQTIFVSATLSEEVERLARQHMHDPVKIVTSAGSLTASLVKQFHIPIAPWDKKRMLLHVLTHEEPALTLIFCRLKRTVDELAKGLTTRGIEAHAMHGDMSQGKRNSTMKQLKDGKLAVVICSDLASRGIDVEGVSHVINFDLPDDPELYIHRIGRTARAGKGGLAYSLVTPAQGDLLTSIEMLINAEIPKLEYPDFVPNPPPPGWRDEAPGGRPEGGLRIERPEGYVEPAAPAPKVSRTEQAAKLELPVSDPAKVDATKFPGGIVPTKLPPKRLFGKMPGRGR